jgi:hypothetical protein
MERGAKYIDGHNRLVSSIPFLWRNAVFAQYT